MVTGQGRRAVRIEFRLLQIVKDIFGATENRGGKAGQARNLDPIALVGEAGQYFAKEDYLLVPFTNGHIEIHDSRACALKIRDLMVVRCEKRSAADSVVKMLSETPSYAQTVKS